jgi:hypothetical protein
VLTVLQEAGSYAANATLCSLAGGIIMQWQISGTYGGQNNIRCDASATMVPDNQPALLHLDQVTAGRPARNVQRNGKIVHRHRALASQKADDLVLPSYRT